MGAGLLIGNIPFKFKFLVTSPHHPGLSATPLPLT
jgi:hypothetical protein